MFIQVPETILKNHNIHANSKLLLGLIVNLNRAELGCLASNRYFSNVLGVSIPTINRYLVDLKNNNYIDIDFIDRKNKTKGQIRIIVPTNNIITSMRTAKNNVIKAQNKWYREKNILPRDIESDWLDEYIANIK